MNTIWWPAVEGGVAGLLLSAGVLALLLLLSVGVGDGVAGWSAA
jgi:hypothetical protein